MMDVTTIGFDADDTLWHNERIFKLTQDRLAELLADYSDREHLQDRLLAAERRNVHHYGFGVKGFTLSMIETAIEVTDGRVPAAIVGRILESGRDMLSHPVECFEGVEATLRALRRRYRLVVVTKGDLFDQERKLAASGLDALFDAAEIVSDKTPWTYRTVFSRHGDGAERAVMVGNSLRSDVVPALEAGAWAVHIPYALTWAIEHADEPVGHPRFRRAAAITELEEILAK